MSICDWSAPGSDPYVGTPRAAISALATIPAPVRAVLIERAERHAYDDVVFIDRDTVRGAHEYAPAITYMAFGTGRVCVGVDRSKWPASRVESGMVFCEGAFCVVRPSVCNNWSIVTRIAGADRPVQPAMVLPRAESAAELIADPLPPSAALLDPAESAGSATYTVSAGPVIWTHWPELPVHVPAPVAPIPEPSKWALFAGGLVAVAAWCKRKGVTCN